MVDLPEKRSVFLRRAVWERKIPRYILCAIGALGTWDLFVAQFFSPSAVEATPRMYDIIMMAGGFFVWWEWLLILLVAVAFSALEYAYRQSTPNPSSGEDRHTTKSNEFSELLGAVSAAKDRLYEKPFEEALIPEVNQWIDDTKELIRAAVGDADASLFMSNAGIVSYGDGSTKSKIRIALERRSQRLNELIQRLDTVVINHDFDGDKWREKFNQNQVLALAKRRSEGVSIRNDGQALSSVDAIPGWIRRYVKWRENTTEDIRPLSEVDAEMFSRLDTYEPTPLIGNYLNDEHVRHVQHLTEWLKRLDALIRKYQQEYGTR